MSKLPVRQWLPYMYRCWKSSGTFRRREQSPRWGTLSSIRAGPATRQPTTTLWTASSAGCTTISPSPACHGTAGMTSTASPQCAKTLPAGPVTSSRWWWPRSTASTHDEWIQEKCSCSQGSVNWRYKRKGWNEKETRNSWAFRNLLPIQRISRNLCLLN